MNGESPAARATLGTVVVSAEAIAARIPALAREIIAWMGEGDDDVVIVPVMTGAFIFAADLVRHMPVRMRITLATVSSYPGDATTTCAREGCDYVVIVGDAFARPILKALDAGIGSIATVEIMISSGTMWSPEVKAGLLGHAPNLMIVDSLGSSEGLGLGMARAMSYGKPVIATGYSGNMDFTTKFSGIWK